MNETPRADDCMHPGGFEITRRAFDFCTLPPGSKILDVGCGHGQTAAYLAETYGFRVTGVDNSADSVALAKEKHPGIDFSIGTGEKLDFASGAFDCVLMECSLSLFGDTEAAVREASRVLLGGGYLVVHDLYIDGLEAVLSGLGFEVLLFEDRKPDLINFAASLIFRQGGLGEYDCLKRDNPGYFLLVAHKGGE